ncbi:MAG: transglycosylase SLT domain-containing protein [Pseudorhodobacter sp.]
MVGPRTKFACLFCLVIPAGANAAMDACLQAAHEAAARHGVPGAILVTIAQAESGTGPERTPWPWTLNAAGKGHRFDSSHAALKALRDRLDSGETSVDIGCFQLNFRWHGHAFASLEDMIDPPLNADHAARFLATLYRESGDWREAAGAYHSRREEHATPYVRRLERIFAELRPDFPRRQGQRQIEKAQVPPEAPKPDPGLLTARPPLALGPVRPLAGAGA